jgi:flagellar basal body-associated protein FliL
VDRTSNGGSRMDVLLIILIVLAVLFLLGYIGRGRRRV